MKTYKLHDDGFAVTVTVTDGPAAGTYETDLHSLTNDVVDGVWDTRRTIRVNGVDKNLKLKVDDCDSLGEWVDAWEKRTAAIPHKCSECGCTIARGHESFVSREFAGTMITVALCECCSDSTN